MNWISGEKNKAAQDSAEAAARASRYDRQTVALTVQSSVATSYFDISAYQDRLAVARRNLANAEEVLSAVRDRQAIGTATELDVAQQESEVASRRAAIPPLEQDVRQNVDALALLTARLPQDIALPDRALSSLTIPEIKPGLPSELLQRRPDVLYAEENLIGAHADINEARAALFPSITLSVEGGLESGALSSLLKSGSFLYSLGTSASQPIFHGGALEGAVEKYSGKYEELIIDYHKAVLSAFIDVEDALIAVAKTAEQEDAERLTEQTARRAYDLSLDRFRGGVVDITTVLDTQHTLFTAEDSLVQARQAHLKAVVGLYKVLGGGWDGTI